MTVVRASTAEWAGGADAPLSSVEFDARLSLLGPFESAPHLAVAVSGGADSLCLVLLADAWARTRGGRVTALTVDHGLRAESAAEARQTGAWLAARGIEHHVLPWRGEKPSSGLQAAARNARYRLMEDWCRAGGVLHLLLAHHADDQAETCLMRARRGSSVAGLAGMPAIAERGAVRLLRPLLGVDGGRLRATLGAAKQRWVEDPSNGDVRFERVRVRLARAAGPEKAAETARLLRAAAEHGERRAASEAAVSRWLATHCAADPAGFVRLSCDGPVPDAAFSQVLRAVGGRAYPPDREKVADAVGRPVGTLAGCRWRRQGEMLLVQRENRHLPRPRPVVPGESLVWDRRFRLRVDRAVPVGCRLAPLGEEGWAQVHGRVSERISAQIPHTVRVGLPALWKDGGVFAVPFLHYIEGAGVDSLTATFHPPVPLGGTGFPATEHFDVARRENQAISRGLFFRAGPDSAPCSEGCKR
jgi:tRNA(Ile)-lysidine synthase